MRVAWLADTGNVDGTGMGGAEFTEREFAAAAPEGVEVLRVLPDAPDFVATCDAVCCFNVTQYPFELVEWMKGKPVYRYWNDVAPNGSHDLTRWFVQNATNIFCSPLHYDRFPWRNGDHIDGYELIPPPVPLQRFRDAAESAQERHGAVSIAAWRGWGKEPFLAMEWAHNKTDLAIHGGGKCAPPGSTPVPYEEMPALLAKYETFVYLPTAIEPFCRLAAEAWAAGCKIVTNRLVGANYWLEENPEAIDEAPERFWELVTQ